MGLALDMLELSKVKIDLLREVYQEFFDPEPRKALGEFYTNEIIVNEILDYTNYKGINILNKVLLDPACGSGTFLIMAIKRFIKEGKNAHLSNIEILKRINEQIKGIDIHPFAVAMAKVNYLLALSELITPNVREALEELEIPIYWTDSLATFTVRPDPTGLPIVEVDVTPLGKFMMPDHREVKWSTLLVKLREAVDSKWGAERFLNEFSENTRNKYRSTLLNLFKDFNKREEQGKDSRWLTTLRNVTIVDELKEGCDFVVGNPPWVRIHNINKELQKRIDKNFKFYGKKASWNPKLKKTIVSFRGQADYSLAFVESALTFLKQGGIFGFVITSNVVRALYAGTMRRTLLKQTIIMTIKDYSLSSIQLFEKAQNAPLILVLKKDIPPGDNMIDITMINRLEDKKEWKIPQNELSLYKEDYSSPWLMAPLNFVKLMRKMKKNNVRLGDLFRVTRGIHTAANKIYFINKIEKTDTPNLFLAKTEGGETTLLEAKLLRPITRGRDIDEWHYNYNDYMIWPYDNKCRPLFRLPQNVKNYFAKHKDELKQWDTELEMGRRDLLVVQQLKKGAPYWIIVNVNDQQLKNKIAWQDIEKTIKAVCIPSKSDDYMLNNIHLIADNTVYFIAIDNENLAYAITAILNSSLVRAYVASYVMRTGAQYCHYKGWYMGLIPFPSNISQEHDNLLIKISKGLHKTHGKDEELLRQLDKNIARLYDISTSDLLITKDFLKFFISARVRKSLKMKPSRKYRKGSKYDPILDAFMEGTEGLVEVTVEGRDANYLRTQLNKRIEAKELKLKTSVVNNVLYLEKV